MLIELRDWSTWLAEWLIVFILIKEYLYDLQKDEAKRQRKTKTSKKTTNPNGVITEENIEVIDYEKEEKHTEKA